MILHRIIPPGVEGVVSDFAGRVVATEEVAVAIEEDAEVVGVSEAEGTVIGKVLTAAEGAGDSEGVEEVTAEVEEVIAVAEEEVLVEEVVEATAVSENHGVAMTVDVAIRGEVVSEGAAGVVLIKEIRLGTQPRKIRKLHLTIDFKEFLELGVDETLIWKSQNFFSPKKL